MDGWKRGMTTRSIIPCNHNGCNEACHHIYTSQPIKCYYCKISERIWRLSALKKKKWIFSFRYSLGNDLVLCFLLIQLLPYSLLILLFSTSSFIFSARIEHKKLQDLPGTSKVGEESHDGFRIRGILLTGVITIVRLLLLL